MMNVEKIAPKETMYGSLTRLNWLKNFLTKDHVIIDLGCGTGSMITIPLIMEGFNVLGVDLDQASIDYGQKILEQMGADTSRLVCQDLATLDVQPDVIILSEVLEHLSNEQIDDLIILMMNKLKPGGHLLVTVPNGYGCFELESFLWYRAKFGWLLEKLYIVEATLILKNKLCGDTVEKHPSSLDSSPHIQRFTYRSLPRLLEKFGFATKAKRGGSFFSGPFSNLFFTGIKPVMKANMMLGRLLPYAASDFYLAVQKPR
jgi:SAM-dependent methyltransferase